MGARDELVSRDASALVSGGPAGRPLAEHRAALKNQISVGYKPTVGSGAWTVFGSSSGTFIVIAPALTITLPAISGRYLRNSSLPVTWTTNQVLTSGELGVWAVSGSYWSPAQIVARTGSTSYSTSFPLAAAPGSGYRIVVAYRATVGFGSWTVFGSSSGTFTVTAR
jgi:hypothetical protein